MKITSISFELRGALAALCFVFLFSTTAASQKDECHFSHLYFSDLQHGWIVCDDRDKTVLLGTTDSGQTWHPLPEARPLMKIKFADANTGWAVGPKGTILMALPFEVA